MKINSGIQCYLIEPENPPKGWKKRFGYFARADDGTVFLPGEMFGQSMQVFLCASWDGEPLVAADDGKTLLFRTDWLRQEYPNHIADIDHIESQIRERCFNADVSPQRK